MTDSVKPKVLDVGQCDFDHGNISQFLSEEFSAEVHRAATTDEAIRVAQSGRFDLVLVNRIFDANGESGLELIEKLQSAEQSRATPVVLVSNFADAQKEAMALGAKKGFGKSDLTSQETRDTIATLLGS